MLSHMLASLLAISSLTTEKNPNSVVESPDGTSSTRPTRQKRPLMLGLEFGLNGLTGFGPAASYTFRNDWSIDTAAGVSAQLVRGGVRVRYTFLRPSAVAPYIGFGIMYGLGTPYDLRGFQGDRAVIYRVLGAPFGQGVAGVVYNHCDGFTLIASLGWTQLLSVKSNIRIKAGQLSQNQLQGIRLAAGSGPVASLTMGFSF